MRPVIASNDIVSSSSSSPLRETPPSVGSSRAETSRALVRSRSSLVRRFRSCVSKIETAHRNDRTRRYGNGVAGSVTGEPVIHRAITVPSGMSEHTTNTAKTRSATVSRHCRVLPLLAGWR